MNNPTAAFSFISILVTIGFMAGANASSSTYEKQERMATAELCRAAMLESNDADELTELSKFRDIQKGYSDILGVDSRNAQYRKIKNQSAVHLRKALANTDLTLASFCIGMLPGMQGDLAADY